MTNENETPSYSERGRMGGRPPKASNEDILSAVAAVIDETDAPVAKTSDIANHVELGEQATRDRLGTLVVRGELRSLAVGSGKVWWLPEPGHGPASQEETGSDDAKSSSH